jgi:hypothetical protein
VTITASKKLFTAAAALTIAGWVAAAGPTASAAAPAATPACGSSCISLYNLDFSTSDVLAVIGASGTSAHTGQFINLQSASASNQGEDWIVDDELPVSEFYYAGFLSAAINTHYGSDTAYEFQYAPDGVESGLCMGTPGPANNGEIVSLQPCGESGDTLWIYDAADQYERMVPLINGTDTNFSYPTVLTANTTGVKVTTGELTGGDGVIEDGQYWSSEYGVLP